MGRGSRSGLLSATAILAFVVRIVYVAYQGCSMNSNCDNEDATSMLCSFGPRKIDGVTYRILSVIIFLYPGAVAEEEKKSTGKPEP